MKGKHYKIILIASTVFLTIFILSCLYYRNNNKSYANQAIERGDSFYLNGIRYQETTDLDDYTITDVLICTTDQGRKLYEIKEYPDYEYIAGYLEWDGEIYKRDTSDTLKK